MPRTRTLHEEFAAVLQHTRWVEFWQNQESGDAPPPAFKDCRSCYLRKQAIHEQDRRGICGSCPMEHLPRGPSRRFLLAYDTEHFMLGGRFELVSLEGCRAGQQFVEQDA